MKMLVWVFGFFVFQASAQDINLENLSLEDLLDVKTAVASKRETSARSTPGIVSIITEEEIRNMGARDLIDVLHLIPGFEFGTDVQGVVGLGVRGNWSHEGKSVLIIDGQVMNEYLFSSTQYGNHYPVDHIKRIEVIRGPGSAIYGGYAELAVINITTKKGSDLNGAKASLYAGRMEDEEGRYNYSAQIGETIGEWDMSFGAYMGKAKRSTNDYVGGLDFDGNSSIDPGEYGTYDFSNANDLKPMWFNFGLSNQNVDFRLIYDRYTMTSRPWFGFTPKDAAGTIYFQALHSGFKYKHQVNESLYIEPRISYQESKPWTGVSDLEFALAERFKIKSTRVTAGVNISYDLTEKTNFLGGIEYYHDRADLDGWSSATAFSASGRPDVFYQSQAALFQIMHKTEWADLTFGGRYEDPDFTDSSFVPRAAITRAESTWHGKLLYSEAFRTPGIFNIEYMAPTQTEMKPENTTTVELEMGHKVTEASYLTGNLFSTKIEDPIVYTTLGNEEYQNSPETGTKGVELDYRHKLSGFGTLQFGWAYYEAADNQVPEYATSDDKALLGLPQHKGVLNATYFVMGNKDLKLNGQVVYVGEKYANLFDLQTLGYKIEKLDSATLLNLFFTRENVIPGLSLGGGVMNLLNQEQYYVQPYAAQHGPTPAPMREIVVRADYSYNF